MATTIQAASGKAEEEAAIWRSYRRRRQCRPSARGGWASRSSPGRRGRRRRSTGDPLSALRDLDAVLGQLGGAAVLGGEHPGAVLGDPDRVLEVGGVGAVQGDHGPA